MNQEPDKTDADQEALLKERRLALLEESDFLTSRISESVRVLGFGFLAIFYAVFTEADKFEKLLKAQWYSNQLIILIAICGALAILFDYLQYTVGVVSVQQALSDHEQRFSRNHWAYQARKFFYVAKQVVTLTGCVALVVFVLSASFAVR